MQARTAVDFTATQVVQQCPPMPAWGGSDVYVTVSAVSCAPVAVDFLSIRCTLGDIRLWVGDTSTSSWLV